MYLWRREVCDKRPKSGTVQTVYVVGLFVGRWGAGQGMPRYPPQPPAGAPGGQVRQETGTLPLHRPRVRGGAPRGLHAGVVLLLSNQVPAPAPSCLNFIRFITGIGQQGTFNTAFSLSFEILGPKARSPCTVLCMYLDKRRGVHMSPGIYRYSPT